MLCVLSVDVELNFLIQKLDFGISIYYICTAVGPRKGSRSDGVRHVGTDGGTAVGRESNSTLGLSARERVWEVSVTGCGVSVQMAEWQSGGRGERGGNG